MRCWLLTIVIAMSATTAVGETINIQTSTPRFQIVDRVHRTNGTVFFILDNETGEIEQKLVKLPVRKLTVSRRVWDPYAGRFREIVGYDGRNMRVYSDEKNHSHVVYWITDKSRFDTTPIPREPVPAPRPCPPLICCGC